MKKRIVSMMLAALCCMGMLTGCVTSADSAADTSAAAEGGQAAAEKEEASAGLDENTLNIYTALEDEQVAEYLEANDQVAWVNYPGLKSSPYYERAKKYMPNGPCGVIAFGLKGGRDLSIKFMDNLRLACIVTHVADARTSVLHPASHTHRQLSDEQLIEAGVKPDLIRFSVGIENVEDIIADIEQALETVK